MLDGFHVFADGRSSLGGDVVAEKIHLLPPNLALLHIHHQAVLLETLKYQLKVMEMLLCAFAGDEDVV